MQVASESSTEWDFGSPIAFGEFVGALLTSGLACVAFPYVHSDPEYFEHQTLTANGQSPQSLASSQTVIGASTDLDGGRQTSFKRKRGNSTSDCERNVKPFLAESSGHSVPHYLTVSLAML